MGDRKKRLGQYFTTHELLLAKVHEFVRQKEGLLLEPSRGAGHIVQYLWERGERRPWVTVEIDADITDVMCDEAHHCTCSLQADFLQLQWHPPHNAFHTIVGNPPYVKVRKGPNLYLQFLDRCLDLLAPHGEMIMIVPTDFLFATQAKRVRERMLEKGAITDLFRPDRENMFEGATQDVVIFRYELGAQPTATLLRGLEEHTVGDVFEVKVGMVSGADDVFRHPQLGNVPFYSRNGDIVRYIFVASVPSGDDDIDTHLITHKARLLGRKIRKFHEQNWFEWGAVRNLAHMTREDTSSLCIYMETLTRKQQVAFVGERMHFDGNLLCLYPKHAMSRIAIETWVEYFNTESFQKPYRQAGRFKMGQLILTIAPVPSSLPT